MRLFSLLCIIVLFSACSSRTQLNNCKYLLNIGVNMNVNLNLPQYSPLQFTSNSVYIANQGNGGIIVTNVGNSWRAWDASDPNHSPNTCSIMAITGAEAKCGCADANLYSLFTGQSLGVTLPCGLKEYRVEKSGNSLFITN